MSAHSPLRIAYFGLPLGALILAKAGFVPRVLCLGHVDGIGARRVRRTLSNDALILGRPELASQRILRTFESAKPDVILSWFWPKRIPPEVLALAPRGAFGTHPSLLPLWRGPDPYFWTIYAGDRETGVTLHGLQLEYDTGPVIAQRKVTIADDDDAWSLAKKLDRPALALLLECATRLAAGEALEGVPQSDEGAIAAPQPDDETLSISFQRPVAAILRLIRAAAPLPGATMQLGDATVEITRAHRCSLPLPAALAPGAAVLCPEGVVIAARDGGIVLDRLRTATGDELRGREIRQLFLGPLCNLPS